VRKRHAGIFAASLLVALLVAHDACAADALAPYRALRHSPSGAGLIEIARAALLATDVVAPADSAVAAANAELPPPPAALYVTLVNGPATRACVGQEPPPSGDLAEAVRRLAGEVRTGDRRRPPVRAEELDYVSIVIGFAGVETPIEHVSEVDPGREGLLIETDRGRVAFLPGEARTVAWAIREARRIGVLAGSESNAHLYRFPVVTLNEPQRLMTRRKDSISAQSP